MGTVYRATCPKCGYEEQFCLGSGLGGSNLLWCIGTLNETEQTEVKGMYENREIASFVVENKLAECRRCPPPDKLKEKTIITIIDQHEQSFVFGKYCCTCGQKLRIYDEKEHKFIDQVACPNCRELFLIINKEGFWD